MNVANLKKKKRLKYWVGQSKVYTSLSSTEVKECQLMCWEIPIIIVPSDDCKPSLQGFYSHTKAAGGKEVCRQNMPENWTGQKEYW